MDDMIPLDNEERGLDYGYMIHDWSGGFVFWDPGRLCCILRCCVIEYWVSRICCLHVYLFFQSSRTSVWIMRIGSKTRAEEEHFH